MLSFRKTGAIVVLLLTVTFIAIPDASSQGFQILKEMGKSLLRIGGKETVKETVKVGAKKGTKDVLKKEVESVGEKTVSNALKEGRVVKAPSLGGKISSFQGKEVVKRNETFDPLRRDGLGRTNLEIMQKGGAPIGKDGNPVNLHHQGQKNSGKLIELTASEHRKVPIEKVPSEIDRAAHDKWRLKYWKDRVKDFEGVK